MTKLIKYLAGYAAVASIRKLTRGVFSVGRRPQVFIADVHFSHHTTISCLTDDERVERRWPDQSLLLLRIFDRFPANDGHHRTRNYLAKLLGSTGCNLPREKFSDCHRPLLIFSLFDTKKIHIAGRFSQHIISFFRPEQAVARKQQLGEYRGKSNYRC